MIYSINKFRHYLLGWKFTFHVNPSALLYLVSKQELTGQLARLTLLLQEFEFTLEAIVTVEFEVSMLRVQITERLDEEQLEQIKKE